MSNEKKHRPSEVLLQLMRYAWDPKFLADALEIGMDDAIAAYNKILEMEAGEIPEQNAGMEPPAAPLKAPPFSGPGAKEKARIWSRLSALFDSEGGEAAEKLAEASNGVLDVVAVLSMFDRGSGAMKDWRLLEGAIDSIEQQA